MLSSFKNASKLPSRGRSLSTPKKLGRGRADHLKQQNTTADRYINKKSERFRQNAPFYYPTPKVYSSNRHGRDRVAWSILGDCGSPDADSNSAPDPPFFFKKKKRGRKKKYCSLIQKTRIRTATSNDVDALNDEVVYTFRSRPTLFLSPLEFKERIVVGGFAGIFIVLDAYRCRYSCFRGLR